MGGSNRSIAWFDTLIVNFLTTSLRILNIKYGACHIFEIMMFLLFSVQEWRESKNKSVLGMPHYVASGSHIYNGEKYRFLIIPRYKKDLETVLKDKKTLSLKTVLTISLQILDVLEYIHDKGYVHSDIKASNIMLGNDATVNNSYDQDYVHSDTNHMLGNVTKPSVNNSYSIRLRSRIEKPKTTQLRSRTQVRKLRSLTRRTLRPIGNVKYIDDIPYLEEMLRVFEERRSPKKITSSPENNNNNNNVATSDHAYLLDFGLASKYLLANGNHKPFCTDERKAHAGTILFCSRDAHKGVPTRRSDLESLGYNIIYWLTGELPWIEDLTNPEEIESKKNRCFRQLELFLQFCFHNEYPGFLLEYFRYLSKLQFHVSIIYW